MKDLKIYYKNKKGLNFEIIGTTNQYIFLEPKSYAIVRYIIKDEGVEVGGKLTNEVVDTDILSVKFITPPSELLSRKSDFDNAADRLGRITSLALNFNEEGLCFYDALFTNLSNEKIKVKVSAYDIADTILENEHSFVDAPDGFIRAVGVTISPSGVEYTLLYRRSGRVVKYSNKASYESMAKLVKDVIFSRYRFYNQVPAPTRRYIEEPLPQSVIDALTLDGWQINETDITRRDKVLGITYRITDEELGTIIKKNITLKDLTNLFKPVDLVGNGHRFIKEGESLLVPCDHVCSLGEVTPKLIIDSRG